MISDTDLEALDKVAELAEVKDTEVVKAIKRLITELRSLRKVVDAAAAYNRSVKFDGQPLHEEYAALCKAIEEWEG